MVSVGVVGCGYWGPNLVRNFEQLDECCVAHVCDQVRSNLDKIKARHPFVPVTKRYDDLLQDRDLDAVVIATPVGTHFELAGRAIMAGKHVFVEKPLAASSHEAGELVRMADQRGVVLMVGHTFRFSSPVIKVKELISSGEIGDVFYVTSSRVNLGIHRHDVSVVWDLAPHDLSILSYWLEEEPLEISACGRDCVDGAKPDVAFLHMRFPSGVVAQLQLSWLSPMKLRRTVVVGSNKMLVYDDTEPVETIKIFDHGVDFREPESFGEFQMSYRTGDINSPRLDAYEPLLAEVGHFVDCVRTGEKPLTDGRDGARVVAALEAAEASLGNGGGFVPVGRTHKLRLVA